MTFQIGDKVIYPNHGLGIVERIEEKTILGTTCGFYHLRIAANDTTVLVPLANVDGVGLRRAIDDGEVDRLFKLLGDGKIDSQQNWKGRFKDNSEKMRSGSIYDVADVLWTVYAFALGIRAVYTGTLRVGASTEGDSELIDRLSHGSYQEPLAELL